jgi:hypothetical protein
MQGRSLMCHSWRRQLATKEKAVIVQHKEFASRELGWATSRNHHPFKPGRKCSSSVVGIAYDTIVTKRCVACHLADGGITHPHSYSFCVSPPFLCLFFHPSTTISLLIQALSNAPDGHHKLGLLSSYRRSHPVAPQRKTHQRDRPAVHH